MGFVAGDEGLQALRRAVTQALAELAEELLLPAPALAGGAADPRQVPWMLASETLQATPRQRRGSRIERRDGDGDGGDPGGDRTRGHAVSSAEDPDERRRLIGLVERAREGDGDAFGQLFDHYHRAVFRFVYYRTGSVQLAEDLTSETFIRALRNITTFTWQGRDFGAWLVTIARNLTTDHFKSARNRLEHSVDDVSMLDGQTDGPETAVLASLTNEALLAALRELPAEQQECIVMRFLQGRSIAEVAAALDRTEGAVKQLQLRGVRNLAKLLPEGIR